MISFITTVVCHCDWCYCERDKIGTLQEIIHSEYIVLMAETMAEFEKKIYSWRSTFERNGQKMNLVKTKAMVSKIGLISIQPFSKKI